MKLKNNNNQKIMKMIKSIIFDLGGVYFTDGTSKAVKKVSKKYHLNSKEVQDFFGTKNNIGRLYRQGKLTSKQFWQEFQKQFKIKVDKDDLIKEWILCYKPIQGTINLIRELRNNGLKTYFLSDNVKERSSVLEKKYNYMQDFSSGIFSHKVGATKMDGNKIFMLALEKSGNRPNEVIFIDDKEAYVKTAKKLGMHAIHFNSAKQLEREIKKLIKQFK